LAHIILLLNECPLGQKIKLTLVTIKAQVKTTMKTVIVQFQTPQDFQGFRKLVQEAVISFSINNLEVVCKCDMKEIATAINQFGGIVKDEE
jgi:hypothetical protein